MTSTKEQLESYFSAPDPENVYLRMWQDVTRDMTTQFSSIVAEGVLCFGYPNPKYLEDNFVKFRELRDCVRYHRKDVESIRRDMLEFLRGTHTDDKDTRSEFEFYRRLFAAPKECPEDDFPAMVYPLPYGVVVDLEKKDGGYVGTVSSRDIDLDFITEYIDGKFFGVVTPEFDNNGDDRRYGSLSEKLSVNLLRNSWAGGFSVSVYAGAVTCGGTRLDGVEACDGRKIRTLAKKAVKDGYRGVIAGRTIYIYDEGNDITDFTVHRLT